MKLKNYCATLILFTSTFNASAWDAKVTNILHHRDWVAVTLTPDPGPGKCEKGSPYLVKVDETAKSQQLFSMILTALATGKTISGYDDPCVNAIWGNSRPSIERLNLKAN